MPQIAPAKRIIGAKVDIIPNESPAMMLVAAPVEEFLIIPITGFLPIAV